MQKSTSKISNQQPTPDTNLIITKQSKQTLTNKQKEFNRLVKQLEKLKTDHQQLTTKLSNCLTYYSKNIYPLIEHITEMRTTSVKMMFKFYEEKQLLKKADKNLLGDMILETINSILSTAEKEPDAEIITIFNKLNAFTYEEIKKNDFNNLKIEMEQMFEGMGYETDFGDINENMTEFEILQKLKEKSAEYQKQEEDKNSNKKKTKKELQQEQNEKLVEAAKKKNLNTIYKQLAKIFHPDLEIDESKKKQKEELMKQLTVAYEANDLHTLLKLEMEWILKEEHNLEKLSDDKLGIYNQVLKEQIQNVEMEIEMETVHPRYVRLQKFETFPYQLEIKHLVKETKELKELESLLVDDATNLSGNNAVNYVKDSIKQYKKYQQMNKSYFQFLEIDDMGDVDDDFMQKMGEAMFEQEKNTNPNKPKKKTRRK